MKLQIIINMPVLEILKNILKINTKLQTFSHLRNAKWWRDMRILIGY